jgi:sugar phosphate isomerase/epimerase
LLATVEDLGDQVNTTRRGNMMDRRTFLGTAAGAAALLSISPWSVWGSTGKGGSILLGGPVDDSNPDTWIKDLQRHGYRATYCPIEADAPEELLRAFTGAAKIAGITIAEVGAWSNPISLNDKQRAEAVSYCQQQLDLADRIGAKCCVNIAGSRSEIWDGPHPDNVSTETFHLIVESVRKIIDAVNPTRTYYTLETMPWVLPDSPDSYLRLIHAIDRPRFAAHLDPVNLVNSPRRYYQNADLIRECFHKLGAYIKSCHAKDIRLEPELTTHLNEVRPGLGGLDYAVYLSELAKLDGVPLMLEHLETGVEYQKAARFIRTVAHSLDIDA